MGTLTARRSWRAFRASWARWVAILVLLVCGLGVMVGLVSASLTTLRGIELGRTAGHLADGGFSTEAPLTPDQRQQVEALGVRVESLPYVDVPGTSAGMATEVRVLGTGRDLNRPVLDRGRLPANEREVVVERLHAEARGLLPGDPMVVGGQGVTISGLGSFPDYALASPHMGSTADPDAFALVAMAPGAADRLALQHADTAVSAYGYAFDPEPRDDRAREAANAQVRRTLLEMPLDPGQTDNPLVARALDSADEAGVPVHYPVLGEFTASEDNPRITSAVTDSRLTMNVTLVSAVLVMVLVAYVLTEFSRDRMSRESTVIGAWSAMGMAPGQVLRHYLVLPMAVTAIGALLGTALGHLLAPDLDLVTGYYSVPQVPARVTPLVATVGIGLPLGVVLLVHVWVLGRQLDQPVHALLRPPTSSGPALPLRLARLPFITMFRIRQAARAWASYALIGAGLFMSILLLVFGLGMRSSMDGYLSGAQEDLRFGHFYTLQFPDLAAVPEGATPAVAVPLTLLEEGTPREQVTVLGIAPDNPYFEADVAGLGPHEVVLASGAATKYRVGVGDRIVLADGQSANWGFDVVGIADYGTGAFAFTSPAHAEALLEPGVAVTSAWMASGSSRRPADPAGTLPPDTVAYYNALFSDEALGLDPARLASHSTRGEMLSGVEVFTMMMGTIVNLTTAVAMLILVIVLYVLIRMVVARQRYSISLVKALGYSPREVDRLYLDNYFWLVVGVVAVALPTSVAVMGRVWRMLTSHVVVGIPFVLTWRDQVLVIVLALVAYALVRVATASETRAVSVVEILKFRE